MKKQLITLIIGLILGIGISVGATIIYNASEISFTPSDNSWNVTNVNDAINDIKNNYLPKSEYVGKTWLFNYIQNEQLFEVVIPGTYKIELWGASGGSYSSIYKGGNGGYTSGNIKLKAGEKLYIYVGGQGPNNNAQTNVGGYNGGGYSGSNPGEYSYGGGGATDVRLVNGTWSNFDSLKSRIMVAAGGGGGAVYSSCSYVYGGAGGGLTGESGTAGCYPTVTGATQTSTGTSGQGSVYLGSFGSAKQENTNGYAGGGGSGYYGGVNGYGAGGSGGSSFISGYEGCNAIAESSTSSNIIHTGQSIHYSGYQFTDAQMIAGNESMPTHDGSSTMTGNSGNGYSKITLVSID